MPTIRSKHTGTWPALVLVFIAFILAAPNADAQVQFSDKAVEQAISRAQDYLWSQQRPDGSWAGVARGFVAGPTALASYSLLASDVNPQEERMARALMWLRTNAAYRGYITRERQASKIARLNYGLYGHESNIGLLRSIAAAQGELGHLSGAAKTKKQKQINAYRKQEANIRKQIAAVNKSIAKVNTKISRLAKKHPETIEWEAIDNKMSLIKIRQDIRDERKKLQGKLAKLRDKKHYDESPEYRKLDIKLKMLNWHEARRNWKGANIADKDALKERRDTFRKDFDLRKQRKKLNKLRRELHKVSHDKVKYAGLSVKVHDPAESKSQIRKYPYRATYTLAMNCNAWHLANSDTLDAYKSDLKRDAAILLKNHVEGHYYYDVPAYGSGWCNSNSQLAVLGVWSAVRNDLKVPNKYWKAVRDHWIKYQQKDGGWGYHGGRSTAAMSASGVATLFIVLDNLYAGKFAKKKITKLPAIVNRMNRGMKWLNNNFQATMAVPTTKQEIADHTKLMGLSDLYYYLYSIERVGLASGQKHFGANDWYKIGATRLLQTQQANGAWGNHINTAFAILFLVRGQHPVLINKLQYTGDWNNRPRDMAMLTRWIGKTFESPMNWQIIKLRTSPLADWHDAPILYIAGDEAPNFSDADLKKLRTYVKQGGMIWSVGEFNNKSFSGKMRQVYKKLFPHYKLTIADASHPIYSDKVYFKLGNQTKIWILSNGVRPLAIHCDGDLPAKWQAGVVNKSTLRYFQTGLNVVTYATGSLSSLRKRGVSHWPIASDARIERTVNIARLKFTGNYDPEPLAWKRFAILMRERTGTDLKVSQPIPLSDLPKSGTKTAVMSGVGEFDLSDKERKVLKKFITGGGTLIIDAAAGDIDFAESAEDILADMFPKRRQKLRQLSLRSDLFHLPDMRIRSVQYRKQTYAKLRTDHPNLKAITIKGRPAVFFSAEDLTAGLVGNSAFTVDGYSPKSSYELMRNMVLLAAASAK